MPEHKKPKVQWRAKFPRTKREEFLQYWGSQRRLQAADAENSRVSHLSVIPGVHGFLVSLDKM